jgi:hypothetical protein
LSLLDFSPFFFAGSSVNLVTKGITDMKIVAVKQPTMLLSIELWVLKNKNEKRISVTTKHCRKQRYL